MPDTLSAFQEDAFQRNAFQMFIPTIAGPVEGYAVLLVQPGAVGAMLFQSEIKARLLFQVETEKAQLNLR